MNQKTSKLTKLDFIILGILILSYGILSFYKLGSFENPNTFVTEKEATLELSKEAYVEKIRYFTGHEMGKMQIYSSADGKDYTLIKEISSVFVFTWNDENIGTSMKYLKIVVPKESNLGEIALYDNNNQKIKISPINKASQLLVDEGSVVPKEITSYNSAYFDEVYFARTAYEYASGLPAYEWVHPPLGKVLISIPIKLFHMAPFYYRLMGNIAGILMIPILYILAKRIFKKTKYALLPALLLSLDGFHFAHTRMASVDPFLVLFILLSFLFMYEYLSLDKETPLSKKYIKLGLCGFFMGCSIATKWTGLFGGLALSIFFFIHFVKTYHTKETFLKKGIKILIFCIGAFVIVPLILYVGLYLLFPNMFYFNTGSIPKIWHITQSIFDYHSGLQADHGFYSSWYTWPLMWKPVWYYAGNIGNLKSTISGFGNPIVWWFGTISMIYIVYKAFKKDKYAIFIGVTYICLLISYVGITRGMFLYHYFPALPFTLLASTLLIRDITEKTKKNYAYIILLVLVAFFFYYFFPIVSGTPMVSGIIEGMKWLPEWYF